MELADLKALGPVRGIPPWQDQRWLAEAEDWIDARCAEAGLTRSGTARARCRPQSVVAAVPTEPDRFIAPIAADFDRGWSLTHDGGPTLREQLAGKPGTGAWHRTARDYARLQQDLARHADELLAIGLADLRPAEDTGRHSGR